jgi:hypothetical protein
MLLSLQLHKSFMSGDTRQALAVPRLHVAGRKQGNLGWYLFFEIGKQRDERHLIEQRCRLELATATFRGDGNCGGEQRTAICLRCRRQGK